MGETNREYAPSGAQNPPLSHVVPPSKTSTTAATHAAKSAFEISPARQSPNVPAMISIARGNAARKAGLRVFYAPHRRYRPGDYESWKYITPIQKAAWSRRAFEYGTWGGEFRSEFAPQPGEILVNEHWGSSGFANTDLDLQLKRHGAAQEKHITGGTVRLRLHQRKDVFHFYGFCAGLAQRILSPYAN